MIETFDEMKNPPEKWLAEGTKILYGKGNQRTLVEIVGVAQSGNERQNYIVRYVDPRLQKIQNDFGYQYSCFVLKNEYIRETLKGD